MSSALVTMTPMTASRGTTATRRRAIVITSTASPRLFFKARCSKSRTGQVVTTIMPAQTVDMRKGRRIQNTALTSMAIARTCNVARVTSYAFVSVLRGEDSTVVSEIRPVSAITWSSFVSWPVVDRVSFLYPLPDVSFCLLLAFRVQRRQISPAGSTGNNTDISKQSCRDRCTNSYKSNCFGSIPAWPLPGRNARWGF